MSAKQVKNTTKESELSSNNLLDDNQGKTAKNNSSYQSEKEPLPHEETTLKTDRNKIIIKELKVEYKGENEIKNDNKTGDKNSKPAKFEWAQFKKLLSYVQKERFLLFVNYASLLITTLSSALIPYMIGRLLNEVTKAAKDSNVTQESLMFLGLIIITSVSGFGRMIGSIFLGQNVMQNLKRDIFYQFIGYDLAFFEKHKTGELMSRLGGDVATAKETVSYNSTTFIKNLLICLSNIIMMFYLSWKISLAILLIFPTFYVATRFYFSKCKQIAKNCSDITAAQFEIVEEVFSGIMTVKAFGQEKQEIKRFDKMLQDDFNENRVYGYLNAGFTMMNYILLENIGAVIILWYGGYLVTSVTQDGLTSGDLASFILYSTSLATNSSQFSYVVGALVSATGALERIFELLKYDPAIKITTGKETKILRGAVRFDKVKFSYPGERNVQVLHGIDFDIKSGECVAFVGTSGSGKSTVVKLIERFYDVSNGSVLLDGHNVKEIKASSIREHISIVSQEPLLFSGTILDNIIYGVESYSFKEVESACDMSGVSEFIKNKSLFPLGYKTIVGERGTKLSGGQKQRVAIARALIKKPQILIFDEATSALDSESEYQVQQSIDSLIKNRTMTIIVIAHRLSTIKDCSKIFVMQQGKIVEQGKHVDLIGHEGAYKQLVERQLSQKV